MYKFLSFNISLVKFFIYMSFHSNNILYFNWILLFYKISYKTVLLLFFNHICPTKCICLHKLKVINQSL